MLIEGTCNSGLRETALKKYIDLINQNINPDQILVITLNSYKKAIFLNEIFKINPQLSEIKHKVYTFWGLCYNAFNDNWDYISTLVNKGSEKPNLCGLEVSQYIFKQSIKQGDFSDYISKVNLLHQLFRRYSLIVQNCLTNEEVKNKSKILNETFYKDAQKAIDDYKLKTINYNSFDYLRQQATLPLICQNTEYFKNIKYLIIENADEYSYAFWQFIKEIMPQINDYIITYDKDGSSRCGYLCAYKNGINDFIKEFNPQVITLKDKSAYYNLAQELFNNIKNGIKTKIENISYKSYSKRYDMFENVINEIYELLNNGINASEISVITPLTDEILFQIFSENNKKIKFEILSGSEKLIQINTIKYIIYILKISHNIKLREYELKSILINLLKIPFRKCSEIINEYNKLNKLPEYKFREEKYTNEYIKLTSLIKSLSSSKYKLQDEIKIIYSNIIKEPDKQIDKEKYEFFIKESESFEKAFNKNIENLAEEFIIQIENSVISENPANSFSLNKNGIIISTPQKMIDYEIKTKYQFWLDISSNEWLKQDTGTLYNSWVLNRDWAKSEYTIQDNIELTREKTARTVRKLMLCAKDSIKFYASLYDNNGNENFNGLNDFIQSEKKEKSEYKIIPREDQKPVLEYTKGKMGIMAVPGAGKTTILLALIIKLINEGVFPEHIFVLTYMESAAKNFKERIKSAVPESSVLPNISTIHGLALRIIKENGNYNKAGLDEDFEICDDTEKERIIKELFYKLKIDDEKYDNYVKCISIVKLSGYNKELYSKYKDINDFYKFFEEYNKVLKTNNLIDYDDMLCNAVSILEKNPEILKYYQNICKYIIEDEAQDSTDIQQKLIKLLAGKYKNIVRCGDINQSITSTFTNSNIKSFKEFINTNKKVEMNSSQRCSKPIYNLANNLVKISSKNEETKDAFYEIEIKGTEKNPKSTNTPKYINFEKDIDEKNFIISKIKEITNTNKDATIAVLLRLNSQVNEYNELLLSNGIETAVRTDCLSQNKTFKLIYGMLKVIQNPVDNSEILNFMQICNQNRIYKFKTEDIEYIKNLKTPFINSDPDEIESEGLLQLFWDIDYRLNNSNKEIDRLALEIGLYYAKNSTEKSNSYLISTVIKRINPKGQSGNEIIKNLDYISQKPTSAFKFFNEEEKTENYSSINIMTMHKSKGDEFDYVFIPEANEENYPITEKNVKLKSGNHFLQTIKNSIDNTGIKSQEEQKREQINETLRLLYVGITRAKSELYITNSTNYKRHKNTKKIQILEDNIGQI